MLILGRKIERPFKAVTCSDWWTYQLPRELRMVQRYRKNTNICFHHHYLMNVFHA